MSGINGVSHIALNTADMGRFRRFYEGVLGLRMGVTAVLDHPPFLRHATFHVTDGLALHVFEVPGYDPAAQGIGTDLGPRGRVVHRDDRATGINRIRRLRDCCGRAGNQHRRNACPNSLH